MHTLAPLLNLLPLCAVHKGVDMDPDSVEQSWRAWSVDYTTPYIIQENQSDVNGSVVYLGTGPVLDGPVPPWPRHLQAQREGFRRA
jgi:hypothetical protein